MSQPEEDDKLYSMFASINNATALVTSLQSALQASSTPPSPSLPLSSPMPDAKQPPNPLALLSASAVLLKAQITKLSLLSLNKPFTPSAVSSILATLVKILPSLVAGAQTCAPPTYPEMLSADVRGRMRGVLMAVEGVLAEVLRIGRGEDCTAEVEELGNQRVLRGTGLVWEECDWVVKLAEMGVRGWVAERVKGWAELVGDAVEEVEAWVEEGGEGDGGIDAAEEKETEGGDENYDNLFGITKAMDPSFKPTVLKAIKTISLVRLLYPPLLKRRINRSPQLNGSTTREKMPTAEQCVKLDNLVEACKFFSEETDEVVAALYAGSVEDTESRLGALRQRAQDCVEDVKDNWEGKEDEFTAWTKQWLARLHEAETR